MKQRERIGPNGERRPMSEVEGAMKVGRISTGLESEPAARKPPRELPRGVMPAAPAARKVLLRDWKREGGE